jgi:shikimate dehydrogenase
MKITGTTEIYGILGHPVTHSLSPIIHNAAFQALGLDCCYLPFDVGPRDLKKGIQGLSALGIKGFNLTIPHKEAVIDLLDEVSSEAARIGAVNTVLIRQGRLIGYNTDGHGFVNAFQEETGVSLRGKKVLLLGAGGAARAVAFRLAQEEIESMLIINRTLSSAKALIRDLGKKFRRVNWSAKSFSSTAGARVLQAPSGGTDVIVNATSVGMRPNDPLILPKSFLTSGQVVCDLIYRPSKTKLLLAAEAAGAKSVNGLGMLIHQGALAFELWTGKKPPILLMRSAVKSHLLFD